MKKHFTAENFTLLQKTLLYYRKFYYMKSIFSIGARVCDSSIYLNWLLENIYNKVPNSNSGKNYELF